MIILIHKVLSPHVDRLPSLTTEDYRTPSQVTLTLLVLPQIGQTSAPMVDSHPPDHVRFTEKQPKLRPFYYHWLP